MKKITQKEWDMLQTVFATARSSWRSQASQSALKDYRHIMDELVSECYELENSFFTNFYDTKAETEHAALVEVAEAAKVLLQNTFGNWSANEKKVVKSLTKLAAVRNGK